MVKARKYVFKRKFGEFPKREDFEIQEYEIPVLKDGEVLVKVEYISVDSYLYLISSLYVVPYDQYDVQVGTVVESKHTDYPVGTKVISNKGWCDYFVMNISKSTSFYFKKVPDLKGLPLSNTIGMVGMHGLTAYFGLLNICSPKPGETVAVSGASGSIGSIVGQIAKIKGCRAIGFAGGRERVKWTKNLGFDAVIDYKNDDIMSSLNKAAPNGIDCYFDNVGGELSSQIMYHMNVEGRVSVCGAIAPPFSDYSELPKVTTIQQMIMPKQLRIRGFYFDEFSDYEDAAQLELISWAAEGKLKTKEHIVEGFNNLCETLVDLMKGKIFGRCIVKI